MIEVIIHRRVRMRHSLLTNRAKLFAFRLLFSHDPFTPGDNLFGAFTNAAILQRLWPFAGGIVTSFGVARTQEGRLFRLVDLVRRASSERNSAETLAIPV